MSALSALIIDDELLARNVIRRFLTAFPDITVLGEYDNGLTALNAINELRPELIFLDIEMPELDGFSMLGELEHLPLIIFTTAYNQYAIKAFELNAVDYLLKPFDKVRFTQAVNKAIGRDNAPEHLVRKIHDMQQALNALLAGDRKFISRILIKSGERYSFVRVKDILWFEGAGDYVKMHTVEKTYLKNTSLAGLEQKLHPDSFVRIHRSAIVNVHFIRDLKAHFNGEYHVYLTNGAKLKLSRSYKDKLRKIIDESL